MDFTETNLTEAIFSHCDLKGTKFENTLLDKADLRTATNYSINPEMNKIREAGFTYPAVLTLLKKYGIKVSKLN